MHNTLRFAAKTERSIILTEKNRHLITDSRDHTKDFSDFQNRNKHTEISKYSLCRVSLQRGEGTKPDLKGISLEKILQWFNSEKWKFLQSTMPSSLPKNLHLVKI